jgi:hypothetical protein
MADALNGNESAPQCPIRFWWKLRWNEGFENTARRYYQTLCLGEFPQVISGVFVETLLCNGLEAVVHTIG